MDTKLSSHRTYILLKVLFYNSPKAWFAFWVIFLSGGDQAQLHAFGTSLGQGTSLANFGRKEPKWFRQDLALRRLCINMFLGIPRKQLLLNLFLGLSLSSLSSAFFICIPLIEHVSFLREKNNHVVSFWSAQSPEECFQYSGFTVLYSLWSTKF